MHQPRIIGITGGIGSGKSTVGRIFESLGVPLFQADLAAKDAYHLPSVKRQVSALFGEHLFDGEVLRKEVLANIVFNDANALQQLNEIIHPAVRQLFEAWRAQQSFPYVLREAAILIESGTHTDCAHVLLVRAPEHVRIARVMQRDQVSEAQVRARMLHQWSEEKKLPYCDAFVTNDGVQPLLPQVLPLHQQWLKA